MEVFIPHLKDRNIYLDEIIFFSDCNFIFGNSSQYKETFEIVNIHFPEAIFDWTVPTIEQLSILEKDLLHWKKHSKIVLTVNDIESHYDEDNKFVDLFKLVQKHVDGVIHLGNYSLEKYRHLFSASCKHTVIYHPLYESLAGDYETANFQHKFNINFQDKYVVSVIGCIRSMEEVKLIFKIFKKIPHKNKILIIPNMIQFANMPPYLPYRFRKVYKKIAEKIFCYPLSKNQYYFAHKFLDYNYMVDLVKNSALIVIPRIKNLNSGNLYLGLTFDKPMIIPKVGNLTETADFFNFPLLDLEKKNYDEVIKRQLDLNSFFFKTSEYLEKKSLYKSKKIAKEYEIFFYKMIDTK